MQQQEHECERPPAKRRLLSLSETLNPPRRECWMRNKNALGSCSARVPCFFSFSFFFFTSDLMLPVAQGCCCVCRFKYAQYKGLLEGGEERDECFSLKLVGVNIRFVTLSQTFVWSSLAVFCHHCALLLLKPSRLHHWCTSAEARLGDWSCPRCGDDISATE